jgi:hypothetical protein
MAAVFVPSIFDLGQGDGFGFDFQFGGYRGLQHASNGANQSFAGDASDAAAHQGERGRAQRGAWQNNITAADGSDLNEADGDCVLWFPLFFLCVPR